jgi:hypothetical protein
MLVYNAFIVATSLCDVWAASHQLSRNLRLGWAEARLQQRTKHDVNIDVFRLGMAKCAR